MDEALTFGLGAAIHRLRVDGVVYFVWFISIAAEDIVGGNVYEQGIMPEAGVGQHFRGKAVDKCGQFWFILSFVYGGVGSTVDASINIVDLKTRFNCGFVADIQGVDIGEEPLVLYAGYFLKFCSQLASTACD